MYLQKIDDSAQGETLFKACSVTNMFTLVFFLVFFRKQKKLRFKSDVYTSMYLIVFCDFLETFQFLSPLSPSVEEKFSTERKREFALKSYFTKGIMVKMNKSHVQAEEKRFIE